MNIKKELTKKRFIKSEKKKKAILMMFLLIVDIFIWNGVINDLDNWEVKIVERHASAVTQEASAVDGEAKGEVRQVGSSETHELATPREELTGEFSAYTARVEETDSDPFTMASGNKVYDGAIANNCLDFGTKVEVLGKTYTVEDRMNSRYGCDHLDIYFEDYQEAIKFGRKQLKYKL